MIYYWTLSFLHSLFLFIVNGIIYTLDKFIRLSPRSWGLMFIYFEFYRSEEKSNQNWCIIAPNVHRSPTEEKQGNCLKLIMHRQNHSTMVPADDACQGWFSMFIKFDGSEPQDCLAVTVKDYLNITILQCCGILIRNEPAFVLWALLRCWSRISIKLFGKSDLIKSGYYQKQTSSVMTRLVLLAL